ncbi:MAG TPA: TauD/TfdA family dioxygenase [Steroidobacteraceae bacterium]|nr:TauD/TfdA family dioxygenase [Steroidobacteraceae bacterium]
MDLSCYSTGSQRTVKPLHPLFAAEISGIDFSRPIDSLTLSEVVAAMDRHAVCVCRATGLDDERHIAFSRLLGELELAPRLFGSHILRFKHPELFDAGNLDASGNILIDERRRVYNRGNALWHTDSSFNSHRSSYSLLLAHETPPVGGDTQFADMRAAYDALPQATKSRIDGLVAEHWLWHSRQLAGYPEPTEAERRAKPPAQHPLVQVHPGSGRKTLYLASHASHIVGWPIEEGRQLLRELIEFATQPQFCYTLEWSGPGDLVIWDNRCTMHRATRFEDTKYRRDMRRTTVFETLAPGARA